MNKAKANDVHQLRQFDLYGPDAPQPPYTPAYLAAFRAAQRARSRRITEWARGRVRARALLDRFFGRGQWRAETRLSRRLVDRPRDALRFVAPYTMLRALIAH